MFGLAQEGRWNEIDEVEPISNAKMVRLKSLHVYFPDQIFPIGSVHHIRRFLNLLNVGTKGIESWQAVKLNRMLLEKLREYPETQGRTTVELMHFLYSWEDPRDENRAPQIFKITPGEEGRYWPGCLQNSYIRVGWDKVGDLSQYENEADFRSAFDVAYTDDYNGNQALLRKEGDQVWTLINLEPGDKIIANKGVSAVLGIGTVTEPGYEWIPELSEFNHTVRVQWDTAFAGEKDLPS